MQSQMDILVRLRGYNPPDRTIDDQRRIAVDIRDAADEIERLRQEKVPALVQELYAAWNIIHAYRFTLTDVERAELDIQVVDSWLNRNAV